MNTLILRTIAPLLVAIMVVFAIYVTLRGHNEPGGGFIGGLIAASAMAVYGMASGVDEVRRALRFSPIAYAGAGLALAGLSGVLSVFAAAPFMTGLWLDLEIGASAVALSTPLLFDIGVFLVVFGTLGAVALALSEEGEQ
jgi:multicomponent Na+:H+ antiporter subunit B